MAPRRTPRQSAGPTSPTTNPILGGTLPATTTTTRPVPATTTTAPTTTTEIRARLPFNPDYTTTTRGATTTTRGATASATTSPPDDFASDEELSSSDVPVGTSATGDVAYEVDYRSSWLGGGNQAKDEAEVAYGQFYRANRGYIRKRAEIVNALASERDPQVIERAQRELYAGGFYDDSYYSRDANGNASKEPTWGVFDIADFDALDNSLDYAIVHKVTYQAALAQHGKAYQAELDRKRKLEEEANDRASKAANPPTVDYIAPTSETVFDPDMVASAADQIATRLLGRELNNDERADVVGSVMAQSNALAQSRGGAQQANAMGDAQAAAINRSNTAEAEEANALGRAPSFQGLGTGPVTGGTAGGGGQTYIQGGGVNVFTEVDPQAQAQAAIENRHSAEAKKYSKAQQVNVLLKMISEAGRV